MATASRGVYEDIFDGVELLLSKQGDNTAVSDLNGKVVGLYFSAHWCGPCRNFTPKLATKYEEIKQDHPDFEIVFLSSDQDQKAFDAYYNSMPWIALPYEKKNLKESLSKKFNVQGIPKLVILDGNGEIINDSGRSGIMSRPFPFHPPTFEECLGELFVNNTGDQFGWSDLRGKTLGIYVSAGGYPVGRAFTDNLLTTYTAVQQRNPDFEVIYVGADKTQESFQDHTNVMPWLYIPWEQLEPLKQAIFTRIGVQGIPALYMCQSDGAPIHKNAAHRIKEDVEGMEFPWIPLAIRDINNVVDQINDFPTLILFQHSLSPEEQTANEQKFASIAEQQQQLGDDRQILVCTANKVGGIVERIRAISGMKEETGAMILDIPDNGGFYSYPIPNDEAEASNIIQQYLDKSTRTGRQQLTAS